MPAKKPRKPRPFNPKALDNFALAALMPRIGPGETLWRYTVTVPLEEIQPRKRPRATLDDLLNLQEMFIKHFGGFTRLPNSPGFGRRDPNRPEQIPEMNYNTYFAVLTSPLLPAEAYFQALREELQAALDEGVILIERQDVWIP
jgi:hypothetical protein